MLQLNSSISRETQENDRNFSMASEKSDANKRVITKALNWNFVFIIITLITSLTILGLLLWKTNLL